MRVKREGPFEEFRLELLARDMDILLLTPVNLFSYQIIPDLGLMYLASSLRKAGHEVEIKDCRKDKWDFARLSEHIQRTKPAIVGIKCYSYEVNSVKKMTETARAAHPSALILVGGPHPSMDGADALRRMPAADYAFIGESEKSLALFVSAAKQGRLNPLPEEIRGIAFREGAEIMVRECVWEKDLDQIPFPAWDLMPPGSYPDEAMGIFVKDFPAAPMSLSRGCPFRCSHCGSLYVSGGRLRYRSLENVLAEIDLLENKFGVRTFTFTDDNFTWDRARAMALFKALAARPKKISFTFPNGVRADSLDRELLCAMEDAGCYLLGLGIESSSDATLRRMNKQQTRAMTTEVIDLIRSTTNMRLIGSFILGYPGESLAEVKDTIRFAIELPIHNAHFCLFIPIPGTKTYRELVKNKLISANGCDTDALTMDKHSLALPGLPPKKLLRLHQYAYLRFYLTPWRTLDLLRQLKSLEQFKVICRRFLKLFR